MKRFYLILFIITVAFAKTNANPIDSTKAKIVAQNFYALNSNKTINSITLAYTESAADGTVAYYVFNINDNDGWVMVCADDAATPILGYNTTGHFKTKNMSPEFNYWKNGYKRQIDSIKIKRLKPTPEVNSQWNKYNQLKRATITTMGGKNISTFGGGSNFVAPLLGNIAWNQAPYYNDSCPGNSYTGCVATAQAQIMKFWKWPPFGNGQTTPYKSIADNGATVFDVPSINLSNDIYDWANMPNSISSQNSAIAQLMYHVGASIYMEYSPSPSGSGAGMLPNNYTQYFGYDTTVKTIYANNYLPNNWINALETELSNNRPIQLSGAPITGSGHSWVCDGYDDNDFFHMNWGWGGYYNGYYTINNLNPGGYAPNNSQYAIIGISPLKCFISSQPILCQSNSISFKSATTITANSYQWTINGKNVSEATNATFTTSALNEYDTVACVINQGTGNQCISNYIVVQGLIIKSNKYGMLKSDDPNNYIDNNTLVLYQGDSAILYSPISTGNQWYYNGIAVNGATNYSLAIKPINSNGYYTLKNSSIACNSDTVNLLVIPKLQKPTIISNGTTLCNGSGMWLKSSIIQDTVKYGYNYTFHGQHYHRDNYFIFNSWYLNGSCINAGDSIWVTQAGNYQLNVYCYSGIDSVKSDIMTITVNAIPSQPIITSKDTTIFCQGLSDTLVSSASSGNQWYLNGAAINGATNTTYTATAGGKYTVTTTTNNCSSSPSAIINITVNSVATPVITSKSTTTFCQSGTDTLVSSASNGNQWYLNGAAINGATNTIYVATASGKYAVIVTANGCNSTQAQTVSVTVNDLPTPPAIAWNGSQLSTVSGMAGYQWYNGTTVVPNATKDTLTPPTAGNYTVKITNAAGCSATSSGYNLVVTAVNTPAINGNEIKVFPNPAKNNVNIRFSKMLTGKMQIRLLDMNGRVLQTITTQQQNNTVPLQNIAQGVYFIEITSNNDKQAVKLFIEK